MKQFKILRTHKQTTIASALTSRLNTLAAHMAKLQNQYPDDEFCIVDADDNPVEIDDFSAADLAHPVAKAKRKQAALDDEMRANIRKKLRRCG